MADQQKKPRDIKDLKARLGRTVAPGQQKAGIVAPGGVVPPGVMPPGMGGVPGAAPGIPAPVLPSGAPVAVPPFMQPPKQKAQSNDPFAAAPASAAAHGPREVRIVVDERAVADSEASKRKRGRTMIILGIGAALGLAVGYGAGNTMSDRNLYNLAVRDGKDILHAIDESSDTVLRAKRLIDSAVSRASPRGGGAAAVDYEAIESLRALKKPFDAGAFARRRYNAFQPATVDGLFAYYNDVILLWEKFQTLAARTLPANNRTTLNQAAQAATDLATTQYGIVPMKQGDVFASGMVVVNMPQAQQGEEGLPAKLMVSSRQGGQQVEKTRYTGAEDQNLAQSPANFVILIDTQSSVGILGRQASAFAEYRLLLLDIKRLMDEAVEVQGRLVRELGEIAKLEEVFTL